MYDFPEHDCAQDKTVAHMFLSSYDNANGRLSEERLWRSRNFAAMVTLRHAPLLATIRYSKAVGSCYLLLLISSS